MVYHHPHGASKVSIFSRDSSYYNPITHQRMYQPVYNPYKPQIGAYNPYSKQMAPTAGRSRYPYQSNPYSNNPLSHLTPTAKGRRSSRTRASPTTEASPASRAWRTEGEVAPAPAKAWPTAPPALSAAPPFCTLARVMPDDGAMRCPSRRARRRACGACPMCVDDPAAISRGYRS